MWGLKYWFGFGEMVLELHLDSVFTMFTQATRYSCVSNLQSFSAFCHRQQVSTQNTQVKIITTLVMCGFE